MALVDTKEFEGWLEKKHEDTDVATASPLARLLAWLDRDSVDVNEGDSLIPGSHLLYFLSTTRQSDLPPEGGNPRDNILPPIPLQRKLWAGSRLWFEEPLQIGDSIKRVGGLTSMVPKSGRSGQMVFLVLRDEILGPKGVGVVEEFDLICREDPKEGERLPDPQPRPAEPQWKRTIVADAPFLFRFSALTYNSHRIHYDYPYVTEVEGYPGLIVTGPMQQMLLLDLVDRNTPDKRMKNFSCKAVRPIFGNATVHVEGVMAEDGQSARLWTIEEGGGVGMTATVEFN